MRELLQKFENKSPEIVFEWNDSETEAKGWVVINSLRGGAAGGGTRMRVGLDKREVESLAKTMEVKFTVSGPAIGGAKSGINFNPADPRKKEVLDRWYKAVIPLLKNYYGTGGDLNVDEIHEVIPITEKYGLLHPQEGVVNGHFNSDATIRQQQINNLKNGVSKIITDANYSPDVTKGYLVADMITGWGVAEAIKHYYDLFGGQIAGKKTVIQGWGNVGAAAGFYLTQQGAKVVGIIDRNGGLTNSNGFTQEEVNHLFNTRVSNMFDGFSKDENINTNFWNEPADIFIPAAASRLVTKEQVESMHKNGLQVIACGANVPFADAEIFMGPIGQFADEHLSVIPDFLSNCGMARVFAYLMSNPNDISAGAIFQDVAATIQKGLEEIRKINIGDTHITASGYEIALKQLV